jgi:cysteine-rich repeat protein
VPCAVHMTIAGVCGIPFVMRLISLLCIALLCVACPPTPGDDPGGPDAGPNGGPDGGPDVEPDPDAPSCSALADAICEAACACGGCALVDDDGERLELQTPADCITLFSIGCAASDELDTAACLDVVNASRCDGDALRVDERCSTGGGDARCGDGVVQPPEECDQPGSSICDENCRALPFCGDGDVDGDEECDDGNFFGGDGCNACTREFCGDGAANNNGEEECDDGNDDVGDGCRPDCTVEVCGDGIVDVDEACDDGNATVGDGCDTSCRSERCGNGVLDGNERCDDGNDFELDFCDSDCRPGSCQNGNVEVGERCWRAPVRFGNSLDPGRVFAVNLDGTPDGETVVVGTRNGHVAVFAFDDDGVPRAPLLYPLQRSRVDFLFVADLDDDGDVDVLAITGGGDLAFLTAQLEVLRRVDGGFVADAPRIIDEFISARLVDLDGDRLLDLVGTVSGVSPEQQVQIRLQQLRGIAGGFAPTATIIDDDVDALEVGTVDLRGDGAADVVLYAPQRESFSIYANVGGVFGAPQSISGQAQPSSEAGGLLAGDVDGDGREELLASTGFGSTSAVLVLHDDVVGGLRLDRSARSSRRPVSNVLDIDADGDLDVLMAGGLALNAGDGTFSEGRPLALFSINEAAEIDVDDDGDLDLVWSADGALQVAQRSGAALRDRNAIADVTGTLLPTDLDGDGGTDLLLAGLTSRGLLLGGDGATFVDVPGVPALPFDVVASAVGDIDGDGDDDVFLQLPLEDTCRLFINEGDDGYTEIEIPGDGVGFNTMQIVDINDDAIPDLVQNIGGFRVLLHDGNYNFTVGATVAVGVTGPQGNLIFADLDGDGLPEAIAQSPRFNAFPAGRIVIARNTDNGTFAAPVTLVGDFESEGLAVGDFDGDDIVDLITAPPTGSTLLLYVGDGDGTFAPPLELPSALQRPTGLLAGDLDNDGRTDLLVFDQFEGLVEFRFQVDALATGLSLSLPTFAARERLLVDVNGDGVLDPSWREGSTLYTLRSAP